MSSYIYPTPEAIAQLGKQFNSEESVVMLNLLKFKKVADYSDHPQLKPSENISGEKAYHIYMKYTQPCIQKLKAEVIFMGKSNQFVIGPQDESWDLVLIVKYPNILSFYALTQDAEYIKTAGHRSAALEDSRLLPIKG